MKINLDAHINVPETVLLDVVSGKYFGPEQIGTRVWQLLRQYGILRTAYEAMLAEYEVTPECPEADLIDLTEKMIEKGLAEIQADTE